MAEREVIIPPGMENLYENFHYAPAVRVDNALYIAGQVGRDENLQVVEGAEAQFTQAFENLKKILTAAGASLDDVVDLVTYHTDMRDIMLFLQVKARGRQVFRSTRAASTLSIRRRSHAPRMHEFRRQPPGWTCNVEGGIVRSSETEHQTASK